jgi:DNA-binding transcriptional regulator YdaS (Cro superfamily)
MLEFVPMNDKSSALELAVANVGGQAEFARLIGVTAQAVSQWNKVPPLRVLEVERVSGVSRHELRPDLYPREVSEARA